MKVKAELSFNHILVTANRATKSGIITNLSGDASKDGALMDVQEIVQVGPFVKKENGIDISSGDKVLLDTRKISARNSLVITVSFHKETGEYLYAHDDVKDEDVVECLLITDREILMKV